MKNELAAGSVNRDVHRHGIFLDARFDEAAGFEVLLKVGAEEERRSRAEQD